MRGFSSEMPNDIVLSVENIGKKFRVGRRKEYLRLSESLESLAKMVVSAPRRLAGFGSRIAGADHVALDNTSLSVNGDREEDFWAIKEISFEVKRGEVLGVVGRNGAGKSTLLKILSRITEPTTGRIGIGGRVGSLLEVGTGFHPELTGRENIFLNGAVLGLSSWEVKQRFDQIVEFAEVEKFLDTPVKRYSSGMYMRLAFAVAAHLETDILIIDEVLAVGDAAFQKKCLGKMGEVASSGRTVLFVSHNLNAVEELCNSVIVLKSGLLAKHSSNVRESVLFYQKMMLGNQRTAGAWSASDEAGNNGLQNPYFSPLRFWLGNDVAEEVEQPIRNDDEVYVYIEGTIEQFDSAMNVGIAVYDENEQLLFWSLTTDSKESEWPNFQIGINRLRLRLPSRLLNQGTYQIEMNISLHFREWLVRPGNNAPRIPLSIQGGLSDSPFWNLKRPGLLGPCLTWELI